MPENNQQQPQYVYVQSPRYNGPDEYEIDLVELFKVLWKKKRLILFISFIFAVLSVAYALYLPNVYKATSRIMPQGGVSKTASLAAQYGGIANMMGISLPPGSGGTGAVLVEVLKGDSVLDAIIDKFNLMEQYEQETRVKARQAILTNYFQANFDEKGSGIITVSYLDEDPQRAADIANAFVEKLQSKMTEMSLSDSKQRREFFEQQLKENLIELSNAEEAMMKYQQSSGVIVLDEQAKKLVEAMANLRSNIVAKSAEISSMKSYLKSDNPRLKLAQSQLQAMQNELKKLEEEQRVTERRVSGDIMLSAVEFPELGVEYQRRVRDLKAANAKYEFMLSQYESAKLGEVSELSTITVIDVATPPDFKDRPSRARIAIVGTFIGFFIPSFWISMKYIFKESQKFKAKNKRKEDDYDDDDDDEY